MEEVTTDAVDGGALGGLRGCLSTFWHSVAGGVKRVYVQACRMRTRIGYLYLGCGF